MNHTTSTNQNYQVDQGSSWVNLEISDKIKSVRDWINGPGTKLLRSQTSKPYNFDEAVEIRKSHEEFEFKCMKALENFAELCEYRKNNNNSLELNELDYLVQNFIEKLNKRTFFVVSCYTYFRLVEELWGILENLQKRSKEVDAYDIASIRNAINELEHGVEKCDTRLNSLSRELERLKILLKPSDPSYLGQLEEGFRDSCRAATEATQALKIRKLVLKKQAKLLECEENVYESIGWIEELLENIELMYQDNCVGKNQLDAEDLLRKYRDVEKQAQTTHAYCMQLLETYGKLCEADGKRLPRNIGLSRNRLSRVWPRLGERLLELQERTEVAENVYTTVDSLLSRVQEYLIELSRNPLSFDRKCGSPNTQDQSGVPCDQRRSQLDALLRDFLSIKSLGLRLVDRLPKGLLADDPIFTTPAIDDVGRMIRLKLYTLWLKIREFEYAVLGCNTSDNTTVTELAPDWRTPRSSNSTMRHTGSLFEGLDEYGRPPFVSPQQFDSTRTKRTPLDFSTDMFISPELGVKHNGYHQRTPSVPPRNQSNLESEQKLRSAVNSPIVVKSDYPTQKASRPTSRASNHDPNKQLGSSATLINEYLQKFKKKLSNLKEVNQCRNVGRCMPEIEHSLDQYDLTKDTAEQEFDSLKNQLDQIRETNQSQIPLVERKKSEALQDAQACLNEWMKDWSDGREKLFTKQITLLSRLDDLKVDLGECISRLNQLVRATVMATNIAADFTGGRKYSDSKPRLGSSVLTDSEVYQMNTITEEVRGMLQTVPAQEQFIFSLFEEVERSINDELAERMAQQRQSWEEYVTNLNTFEVLVTNLSKGYNLVPKIETFKSNRNACMNNPNKQLSHLTTTQIEGRNLETSISYLVKPDRLHPAAQEVSKISETRPRVGWLVSYLKSELKLITESVDEMDMLVTNLRQHSSPSSIDLADLVDVCRDDSRTPTNHGRLSARSVSRGPSLTHLLPAENGFPKDRTPTPSSEHSDAPPIPPRGAFSKEDMTHTNSNLGSAPFQSRESGISSPTDSWRITKPLENVECHTGDMIKLGCQFTGPLDPGSLNVVWYFKPWRLVGGLHVYGSKELIKSKTGEVMERFTLESAELNLENATGSRTGLYTVRIKDPKVGKSMKSTATVKVYPVITNQPNEAKSAIIDTLNGILAPVTFSISYEGVQGVPQVDWTHNGKPIDKNLWQSEVSSTGCSLSSRNVRIADQGAYECRITDPVTQLQTYCKTKLAVYTENKPNKLLPLQIGGKDATGEAFVGGPVTLRCPLPASCPPDSIDSVEWLHDNNVIYSFKPNYNDQIKSTNLGSKQPNLIHNQFQCQKTVWRTYVIDTHCVLATNKVHGTDKGSYTCRMRVNDDLYESTGSLILETPKFAQGLHDQTINVGQRLLLQCLMPSALLTSNPDYTQFGGHSDWEPEIRWYHDGKPLTPTECGRSSIELNVVDDICSLSVLSARPEHAGTYRCEVNLGGEVVKTECKADVQKLLPPKIVTELQKPDGEIDYGKTITMKLDYQSPGVVDVSWFKDGQPLDADKNHYEIELDSSSCCLTIFNLAPSDEGVYTVQLGNPAGSASSSLDLKITKPTPLESILTSTSVIPTFHSDLEKTDLIQPPIRNTTLQLTKPSNPKLILYGPTDTTVQIGQPLHLFCVIHKPDFPITVQWYRNGQLLGHPSTRLFQTQVVLDEPYDNVYRACLKCVDSQTEGFYGIKVYKETKLNGKVWKDLLDESVCWVGIDNSPIRSNWQKKSAPFLLENGLPSFLNAYIGEKVTLTCMIEGNPPPEMCWIKNSDEVFTISDENIEVSRDGLEYKLSIKEIQKSDAGKWTLLCHNSKGIVATSCQLNVHDTPNKLSHQTSLNGILIERPVSQASLFTGSGDRKSEVIEDTPTTPSKRSLIYVAHKGAPEPPEFTRVFTDLNCQAGDPIHLACTITGLPSPAIHWTFNDQPISNPSARIIMTSRGDEHSLAIDEARTSDSGRYAITAENLVGFATCSALVVVCASQINRPTSPLSEPGYTTENYSKPLDYTDSQPYRKRHDSGTQTPDRKRTAFIRSISASLTGLDPSSCTQMTNSRALCANCNCCVSGDFTGPQRRHSNAAFVETVESDYHRTYNRSRTSASRMQQVPSGISRRIAVSKDYPQIKRHRSEGSLIHHCPHCDTIMVPVQRLSCNSKHSITDQDSPAVFEEDVGYYRPTCKQIVITRKVTESRTNHCDSSTAAMPTNPSSGPRNGAGSADVDYPDRPARSRVRQIPVVIERPAVLKSSGSNVTTIPMESKLSRNANDATDYQSENNYSVVESSDNESVV